MVHGLFGMDLGFKIFTDYILNFLYKDNRYTTYWGCIAIFLNFIYDILSCVDIFHILTSLYVTGVR